MKHSSHKALLSVGRDIVVRYCYYQLFAEQETPLYSRSTVGHEEDVLPLSEEDIDCYENGLSSLPTGTCGHETNYPRWPKRRGLVTGFPLQMPKLLTPYSFILGFQGSQFSIFPFIVPPSTANLSVLFFHWTDITCLNVVVAGTFHHVCLAWWWNNSVVSYLCSFQEKCPLLISIPPILCWTKLKGGSHVLEQKRNEMVDYFI